MTTRSATLAALALAAALVTAPATTHAQADTGLTAAGVAAQLAATQQALAGRVQALPEAELGGAASALDALAQRLRKASEDQVALPLPQLEGEARAVALRAQAATRQVTAFLTAAQGCSASEARLMGKALRATLAALGVAPKTAKGQEPAVIAAVEDAGGERPRPLFALPAATKAGAAPTVDLVGSGLHDARCAAPRITLAGEGSAAVAAPTVLSLAPERVRLALPPDLAAGTYTLTVAPQRKTGRFFGCSAQPEAVAAVQVTAPRRVTVRYALTPDCGARKGAADALTGTLPELGAGAASVSQRVEVAACARPSGYSLGAEVITADGSRRSLPAIAQQGEGDLSLGLPDGLVLRWQPAVKTLFLTAGADACNAPR